MVCFLCSIYLYKLGKAPQIQDLHGIAEFTEEEISAMQRELEKYGIQMPAFGKIGGLLASELSVDEAAIHAAVLAINEAIDKGVPADTLVALNNPAAGLLKIESGLADRYQDHLVVTKAAKAARVSPSVWVLLSECIFQGMYCFVLLFRGKMKVRMCMIFCWQRQKFRSRYQLWTK